MALGVEGVRAPRVVLKTTLLTVGTLGFVVCLTMLSESMRSVMDVGGACASGGAYEIRQPCPTGVGWIIPVSIFAGLAFLALGAVGVFSQGGPRPYAFAWSALFLALGWNFLEYGFDAPGAGTSWGWIVCGVVFVLMGGVPLLALFSRSAARWALWGPPSEPAASPRGGVPVTTSSRVRRAIPIAPAVVAAPATATEPAPSATTSAPTHWPALPVPANPEDSPDADATSGDLVARLERLAALHERGSLDDEEYERAKDAILGESGLGESGLGESGLGKDGLGDEGTTS